MKALPLIALGVGLLVLAGCSSSGGGGSGGGSAGGVGGGSAGGAGGGSGGGTGGGAGGGASGSATLTGAHAFTPNLVSWTSTYKRPDGGVPTDLTQVSIVRASGALPASACGPFPTDGGLTVDDAILLRFWDDGRNIAPGTYAVTIQASLPDGGRMVNLQFQSSELADAGGEFFIGASGTVSLQQASSTYVGTFSAGLIRGLAGADAGRVDGTFSASFCP